MKYFFIGIGCIVLGFWLCIYSAYILNYSTFLLERSYFDGVGQQEATHKMKKEPTSDVELIQSGGECVIEDKHLAEDSLVNTETSTDKNNDQEFDKMPRSGSIDRTITSAPINIGKDKNKINNGQKVAAKKLSEIFYNNLLHTSGKMEGKIYSKKINNNNNNNNKLPFCLKLSTYKNYFHKGSEHFKKLASNKRTEKFLKKKIKVKLSQETNSEKKKKKKRKKLKHTQNDVENFKSTIQKMFIPKKVFADDRQIQPIELIPQKFNNSSVKVFKFEEFLSEDECDNLRRVHDMHIYKMSNEDPILCFDSVKTLRLHLKSVGKDHLKVSMSDFTKDGTLSGATTPGQSGPGTDVNEGVPRIPQNSSITGTSPSDCFVSYPGHSLRVSYPSAEKQSVYCTVPAEIFSNSTKDTMCVNKTFSSRLKKWLYANWSYSTAFYPGENYFSTIFEYRVKQAMGLNPGNGGKFQITSYPKGIGYKKHTDCIENSSDRRDRMATVLVYLDTVKKGGETRFPELGISVKPRKGRAVVWNNMDKNGNCESMSAHVADIVTNGHKYILQRWYYYQSFYSLGKRPPQSEKPKRNHGQARVSCDEYAHGSCRWYDEWNHDHLIQYHQNKDCNQVYIFWYNPVSFKNDKVRRSLFTLMKDNFKKDQQQISFFCWIIRIFTLGLSLFFRYLCIYVTAKKPNFPERFRADNGKNRNIPERNLSKQTIK